MEENHMPQLYVDNLVVNSGNIEYEIENITYLFLKLNPCTRLKFGDG